MVMMPIAISWAPFVKPTVCQPMRMPVSRSRNSSISSEIATTPETAPLRLYMPPTTSIDSVMKVVRR